MDFTPKEEDMESTSVGFYRPEQHPLYNDTVLRHLFPFVDYESLKQCRLVCHKWKENIDSLFITRSVLSFDSSRRKIPRTYLKMPVSLPSLFRSIHTEVRFTAFKFEEKLLTPPVREMYLEANKPTTTHLEITKVHSSTEGNRLNYEEMTTDDLIGPNLKNLKLCFLENENRQSKITVVSLNKLEKISDLHLETCILVMNSKVKISPRKLHLVNFKEKRSGRVVNFQTPLNEIIDFSNLTTLYLDSRYQGYPNFHYPSETEPILHFKDCSRIKRLTLICLTINLDGEIFPDELSLLGNHYRLDGRKMTNFAISLFLGSTELTKLSINSGFINLDFGFSISVKELTIQGLRSIKNRSSSEETEMKVTKLNIYKSLFYHLKVDLSFLPKSIEYLFIENFGRPIKCSRQFFLPKLTHLVLRRNVLIFYYFRNFPSLVHVQTDCYISNNDVFNGMPFSLSKSNLDVFVLKSRFFEQMLSEIESPIFYGKTKTFIFHYCDFSNYIYKQVYLDRKQVDLLLAMKAKMPYERFAFGPVKWRNKDFLNSALAKLVNVRAQYYLIDSQNATPLEYDEFLALQSSP